MISVKSMVVLLTLATAFAACGKNQPEDKIESVQAALKPDETTPIGQKWRKLVDAGVPIGDALDIVKPVPGYPAQYQEFTDFVIVWTSDHGAVYMTKAIFTKWQSLTGLFDSGGASVYTLVGVPTADYVAAAGHDDANFTAGTIVVQAGVARVVYGMINLKYLKLKDALGPPTTEEAAVPSVTGARVQLFTGGEIYWSANVASGEAMAVLAGPIMDAFHARLGAAGPGLPIVDTAQIINPDGTQRGLSGRFTGAGIYFNGATNATFFVESAVDVEYDRQGGPNGWLGFPVMDTSLTPKSMYKFNDFEHGVLVWYETDTSGGGYDPHVAVFGNLRFHLTRVQALGNDCLTCGALDLFYFLNVNSSAGWIVSNERFPKDGDWGSDQHDAVNGNWGNIVANSSVWISATVDVWDADDFGGGDDDHRGTVGDTFNIDNLWGLKKNDEYEAGGAWAKFNIKSTHDFQENDFRGQKFWSFRNFPDPNDPLDLTKEQYAETFADVTPDEIAVFNPFNAMYFELYYRGVADIGNCEGMNVEALYAQVGRSKIGMPIHDSYADTQDGSMLVKANPAHTGLYSEINVKQGYQLGLDEILWRQGRFLSGQTHNPGGVFNDSKYFFESKDRPMLNLFDDYFYGGGHSLIPYKWDTKRRPCVYLDDKECVRIYVADPNFPTFGVPASTDGTRPSDRFVEVEASDDLLADNEFYYDGGKDADNKPIIYRGSNWFGGRFYFEPSHIYMSTPITPYYEEYLLATAAFLMTVGSSGATQQISDGSSRTFFEPGLGGIPTRWDQIRKDDASRVPDIAPIMMPQRRAGNRPQLWVGTGFGSTHTYEIAPAPGVSEGTLIDTMFHAGTFSSKLTIPATLGKADKVIAHEINTFNKALSVVLAADGPARPISWTIAGAEKHRWMEFTNLGMTPAKAIKMVTANAGHQLLIDNDGPDTTANMRFKGGPGGTIADFGTVKIPHGHTTMDLGAGPKTTLKLTNGVIGAAGWLKSYPTVTLTAEDKSGVGIAAIEYSSDKVNWTAYTAPFSYTVEGISTLYYRATDKAGNVEPTNSQAIKIDTQLPLTTATMSTSGGTSITYSVTDPTPGSGFHGFHVVQGPSEKFLTAPSGTVPLDFTCSAAEVWGEDTAGNTSSPHIKFTDTVKPTFLISPPESMTTSVCTAAAGFKLPTVTATDDCGSPTLTNDAPAKLPLGSTVITWTAKDAAGNFDTRKMTVTAELGDDVSCCPTGSNIIKGTSNNDTLTGTSGPDCIFGYGGQDILKGLGGNDVISGGDGDDQIWGGDGNDYISGGKGQDKLYGENGNDTLSGGDGDDQAWGGNNDDKLMGGQGQDKLYGESGNDTLEGGSGYDTLDGGPGNDFLRGGTENDTLSGGGGTDQCVQDGGDTLTMCTAVAP